MSVCGHRGKAATYDEVYQRLYGTIIDVVSAVVLVKRVIEFKSLVVEVYFADAVYFELTVVHHNHRIRTTHAVGIISIDFFL